MAEIFNIDDFTVGTIGGTGVFDVLMTTVKAHLNEEFEAGRIRATDYANSYVQLLGLALGESSQFVISKAKLAAEIKLIEAQTRGEDASTAIKQFQLDFILPNEIALKEAQLSIALKEVLIKEKQLEMAMYELTHKLPADVDLVKAQDALYTQKTITEKAQVDNTVVGTGSVIDLSNKLLKEQASAYITNAEQTAAKLMIDTWVVRHTADPDGNLETAPGLRLTDVDIGSAVAKIL